LLPVAMLTGSPFDAPQLGQVGGSFFGSMSEVYAQ
jgi:hypothetical protein